MIWIGISLVVFIIMFVSFSIERGANYIKFKFSSKSFLAFFAFLLILPSLFSTVNANEVGIVYDPLNGGIQDIALGEGLHVKTPLQQIKTISTKLREETFTVTAQTGEIFRENEEGELIESGGGQFATYQVSIQYRIEVENAHLFYRQFGSNVIPTDTLAARVREALQDNSVNYDIFSILKGSLNEIRLETEEALSLSLSELGITVEAFIILDVDAGEQIESDVRNEASAAKQIDIAQKELEAASIQAEKLIVETTAQGEAQQILNSVTVSAINNMYVSQFLNIDLEIDEVTKLDFELNGTGGYLTIQEITDIVVKQLYYDTWDGVLPTVITDGDSGIIINP